jgi:hypothetical protein
MAASVRELNRDPGAGAARRPRSSGKALIGYHGATFSPAGHSRGDDADHARERRDAAPVDHQARPTTVHALADTPVRRLS